VLVASDLVEALAASPLGGLDLAAAAQPALDAAAGALGTTAGPARTVDLGLVVADLGGSFTVVPLIGSSFAAALLVADAALDAGPAAGDAGVAAAPALGAGAPAPAPVTPFPAVPQAAPTDAHALNGAPRRGIEMLHGVDMEVTVELGRTQMTVRDLLALAPGAVLELDRAAGSPADLLVNGRLIARGEVVVVDEDFGLRVTEILDESVAG
jgi:flagellar motor switch protein FliN/FliY